MHIMQFTAWQQCIAAINTSLSVAEKAVDRYFSFVNISFLFRNKKRFHEDHYY